MPRAEAGDVLASPEPKERSFGLAFCNLCGGRAWKGLFRFHGFAVGILFLYQGLGFRLSGSLQKVLITQHDRTVLGNLFKCYFSISNFVSRERAQRPVFETSLPATQPWRPSHSDTQPLRRSPSHSATTVEASPSHSATQLQRPTPVTVSACLSVRAYECLSVYAPESLRVSSV